MINIKTLHIGILLGLFISLISLPAQAQTLCDNNAGFIPRPAPTFGISSNMGPRNTGIPGASRNHRGTDYNLPGSADCGKQIPGPPAGCVKSGETNSNSGYGNTLKFDCGNGIKIQYAHLQTTDYNPNTNLITVGGSGVGSGCHLDYILTLDGKAVDAQCATGSLREEYSYGGSSTKHGQQCPFAEGVNLCDDGVKQKLKEHSDAVFNGSGANNYEVKDGTTSPPGSPPGSEEADPSAPVIINQGTQGLDGTGGVTPPIGPIEEPQPDPEEEDPEVPDPEDKYDPKASTPRCDNSTCITQDHIDNAKHKHVTDSKADPHWGLLSPYCPCKQPTETGANVFRQKPGDYDEYLDAFCTNQGCSYIKDSGGGIGKCE